MTSAASTGGTTFFDTSGSSSDSSSSTSPVEFPPVSLYYAHENSVWRLMLDDNGELSSFVVCENLPLPPNTVISGISFIQSRLMATVAHTQDPTAEVRLAELDPCGCGDFTIQGELPGVLGATALSTESDALGVERLLALDQGDDNTNGKLWRVTDLGRLTVESAADFRLLGGMFGFAYAGENSYLWDGPGGMMITLDNMYQTISAAAVLADGPRPSLEWDRNHERLLGCSRDADEWTLGEFDVETAAFTPYFVVEGACSSLAFPPEQPLCD